MKKFAILAAVMVALSLGLGLAAPAMAEVASGNNKVNLTFGGPGADYKTHLNGVFGDNVSYQNQGVIQVWYRMYQSAPKDGIGTYMPANDLEFGVWKCPTQLEFAKNANWDKNPDQTYTNFVAVPWDVYNNIKSQANNHLATDPIMNMLYKGKWFNTDNAVSSNPYSTVNMAEQGGTLFLTRKDTQSFNWANWGAASAMNTNQAGSGWDTSLTASAGPQQTANAAWKSQRGYMDTDGVFHPYVN